jgi:hypothetical protein
MRDAKYCQMFPEPNWVAQDELLRLERASRGVAISNCAGSIGGYP